MSNNSHIFYCIMESSALFSLSLNMYYLYVKIDCLPWQINVFFLIQKRITCGIFSKYFSNFFYNFEKVSHKSKQLFWLRIFGDVGLFLRKTYYSDDFFSDKTNLRHYSFFLFLSIVSVRIHVCNVNSLLLRHV